GNQALFPCERCIPSRVLPPLAPISPYFESPAESRSLASIYEVLAFPHCGLSTAGRYSRSRDPLSKAYRTRSAKPLRAHRSAERVPPSRPWTYRIFRGSSLIHQQGAFVLPDRSLSSIEFADPYSAPVRYRTCPLFCEAPQTGQFDDPVLA